MCFSIQNTKRLYPICAVLCLAGLLLGLSWLTLGHSTVNAGETSISPPGHWLEPGAITLSVQLQRGAATELVLSNPVADAFINAWPSLDGTEIIVHAQGIEAGGNKIFLNVGIGGGSSRKSYAMTLSDTTHIATAVGFTPKQDVGDDATMNLTTTVGSEVASSGDINFQRAFVETSEPDMISVDDGKFMLEIINTNTFSGDVYLLVMATNAAPGPLPTGYHLASSTYNVRPSGSLTQSEQFMTLNLSFVEPLFNEANPHTLTVVGWDPFKKAWDDLGGDLLYDQALLTLATKRFRIYALATAPVWRDSFQELSLPGVSDLNDAQWGPGQTIILSSAALSGSITSMPITPTGASTWGRLHFSATTPARTGLTVDILDLDDNVVAHNVSDGADLSDLLPTTYPSLKLRATLTRSTETDPSPKLHAWSLEWVIGEHKVYLPLAIKNGP